MVLALTWPIASICIAGFAFLAIAGWALFRGPHSIEGVSTQALDKLARDFSEGQARVSRELEGVRAELAELGSQAAEITRLLREVD